MAGDRFEVPVGPGGGLAAATAALARRLEAAVLDPGATAVYVSVVGAPQRFTQCLVHAERGAWVECVSNEYLEGDLCLTQLDEELLVAAGFERPGDFSPNFHLVVEPPVDWARVALLLGAPFATVFLCEEHDLLEVRIRPEFPLAGDDEGEWR
jgi:hypothetical protein